MFIDNYTMCWLFENLSKENSLLSTNLLRIEFQLENSLNYLIYLSRWILIFRIIRLDEYKNLPYQSISQHEKSLFVFYAGTVWPDGRKTSLRQFTSRKQRAAERRENRLRTFTLITDSIHLSWNTREQSFPQFFSLAC